MNNVEIGIKGEILALEYLVSLEYELIDKNWRTGHLEIDLIMKQKGILVFVEVKSRKNNYFGFPEQAVSHSKQKRLTHAANMYIEQNEYPGEIRFDIISISNILIKPSIFHIKDAFFELN